MEDLKNLYNAHITVASGSSELNSDPVMDRAKLYGSSDPDPQKCLQQCQNYSGLPRVYPGGKYEDSLVIWSPYTYVRAPYTGTMFPTMPDALLSSVEK